MKSLLAVISLALALVSPAFAGIDWGFDNPSTSVSASGGAGTATINVGAFGTGWHDGTSIPWTLGGVPGASGLWDLGRAGSIVLSSVYGSGLVTLQVFQWVNPGTYNGNLTVTVNNSPASLQGIALIGSLTSYGGGWYDYTYNLGSALAPADTVTVSAGSGGAIIDRLTLVPEPATMIAGAILLIPFAFSTWPILRRRRSS